MCSWSNKLSGWICPIIMVALMANVGSAQESTAGPQMEEKDYYYDGEYLAEQEYSGNWAALSGLASGAATGPAGWVLGYAIAANMEVDVARRHTSGLTRRQRGDFNLGYREYVVKKRKRRFSLAAAVGTAVWLVANHDRDNKG